jgi:PAS domain S-box-containing protein
MVTSPSEIRRPGRRLEDKALAQQSMRFEHIMQSVRDYAIVLMDPDGRIERWNSGAEVLLGFSSGEIAGKHLSLFFVPEDREHRVADFELQQATLQGHASDTRWHQKKDGSRVWVSGMVMRLENDAGRHIGYCKIMQNAMQLRKLLDELEEKARLLDLAPVMVRDLNHRITYWNKACERLYGYSAEEAIGQISHKILKTQFSKPVEDIIADVMSEGVWHGELMQVNRAGREIILATTWVLNRNPEGIPSSILVANNEITEQKNTERALRARTSQLAQANQELERFTSVISHDLQAPLFKMAGYAAELSKGLGATLDETSRNKLDYLEKACERLTGLVKEVLGFARAGRAQPQLEPLSLQDVVDDVVTDLSRNFPDARSAVRAENLPTVMADSLLIYQLMQNLISNALKYRSERPLEIRISAQEREQEVVICVKDNGIGIETENLARAFDMFQRLNVDPSVPGSGIGLATSKRVVESHGGHITIDSQRGVGTKVCFALPKQTAESRANSH